MKKFTIKTLTTLLAIITYSTMMHAEDGYSYKEKNTKQVLKKIIPFIPHNTFGGVDAQGVYTKKGKTATITYDQIVYTFDTVNENPNPILRKNKLNLVPLGSFTNHANSKGMPMTTYIFGLPTNDNAQNIVNKDIKIPSQTIETNNAGTIQFQPSKEFAGHDLVGNYISNTHKATINDPSEKNKKSYVFENVQEGLPISLTSNNVRPMQKPILIGSYASTPDCSKGTPKVCSNAIRRTKLYGNLKAN